MIGKPMILQFRLYMFIDNSSKLIQILILLQLIGLIVINKYSKMIENIIQLTLNVTALYLTNKNQVS